MRKRIFGSLIVLVLAVSLMMVPALASTTVTPVEAEAEGCTDILVGKGATVDGSTIITYSCDGARYSKVAHVPGETFAPGTMMPIYYRPYVNSYADYIYWLDKEVLKGEIPQVEETYAYNELQVWFDEQRCGGINEYGLVTGETTIGGVRVEGVRILNNPQGLLYTYTNYKESSLLSLALQRCKTSRDAVEVMGDLACDWGYAQGGEHISVTDGDESWAFEIFGPGPDWYPGCGEEGAVWCAYLIPDDEIGISCNMSRIGLIDEANPDYEFKHSDNVYTLAESLGLWNGTDPFVWYEVYGGRTAESSTREWVVMDLLAPSQEFVEGGELPLTFVPDDPVSVQDIQSIYRYNFEGTDRDPAQNPAYFYEDRYGDMVQSPMASPWGPRDLHTLLDISTERVPSTTSSVFGFVAQVKADLPDPVKGCMWYASCPPASSCYIPLYSGANRIPDSWSNTDLCKINRDNAFWAFHLVDQLAVIKYQSTILDIKGVRDPAEATLFAQQSDLEDAVVDLYASSPAAAQELVTNYTGACMTAASDGYWDLVDYMLFKYFFRASSGAPQELPVIGVPGVFEAGASVSMMANVPTELIAISVNPSQMDFGTVYPGEASVSIPLSVENIGTVMVDVEAFVAPLGTVFENLKLAGTTYGLWSLIGFEVEASQSFGAQLVVPSDYVPQGQEQATLIFEATP